ncbi:hypothetical protein [Morganella phage phiA020]
MATVNIKVYAVVVLKGGDYDASEEIIEPLYISKAVAQSALETYKSGHYGYIAAYVEEYTLQTAA